MGKNNVRRPQAPKRRNFVAKHAGEFNRAETFRDRTKYDRYEDYLKDQLADLVDDEYDEYDELEEAETKKRFVSAIKGDEYDPDLKKEWEDYQRRDRDPDDIFDEAIQRMAEEIQQEIDNEVVNNLRETEAKYYDKD